ncbi:MAG: TolC family protein [Sulfurimonas sp.]|nr:TolC family protein [Sulfurimonas sp.]
MLKNILISGLLCTFLSAQSFDKFLQQAIKNSPFLKSEALSIEQTKERGEILTRYKNPNLELEYSSFNQDSGSNENGYSINYTQPIRLWDVENNRKALAKANMKTTYTGYTQKRASFIRDISLLYIEYSRDRMLLKLFDEEVEIAKKIYDISFIQFQNGRVSKSVKLQAQLDYEISKSSKKSFTLTSMNSYYRLLKVAGINKEIMIEENYSFKLNADLKNSYNPDIKLLKTKYYQALNEANVNSRSVEWIDVYAGVESETDQNTIRVGVNIPLAIFDKKSQEKTIANLQASRTKFLIANKKNTLNMESNRLSKERESLLNLKENKKDILTMELELLGIYKEGYRMANINLLQLQDIKNKVIKTKRELIQIRTILNQNSIYTNYNKGNHNE